MLREDELRQQGPRARGRPVCYTLLLWRRVLWGGGGCLGGWQTFHRKVRSRGTGGGSSSSGLVKGVSSEGHGMDLSSFDRGAAIFDT